MILPKAIDIQTVNSHVSLSNNIPFISFGFTCYENYNVNTGEFDSVVSYDSICTFDQVSFQSSIDNINEYIAHFTLKLGTAVFTFTQGEYYDLSGNPFNIGQVQATITQAIGI
jgi:hypothetical protein